jgi:competence protein ComEC
MVSLVGVITNLLALWVVSFLFYGLILVCLVYLFWTSGAALLGHLLSIPIRYILLIAGIMADVPVAAVYTCSPYIIAWLVFVYALLGLFLLNRGKNPVMLACCITIGLCVALIAGWTEPLLDDTRVTVLNVGQGQCILLQSEGRTCMIDCGGDRDAETADLAAAALLSQGITRLDALILTHNDFDHAGAVNNLLTRIDTDMVVLPEISSDLQLPVGNRVIHADKNLTLTWNNTVLSVFPATFPGTNNEKSLCILFDTEKCDILITGDRNGFGERILLRRAVIPEVDVLIAGHHGSRNSTCEELLQTVRPQTVCISVGADNSYGHPAQELLQRLQNYGCTVYRTDLNGTILIRR